MDFKPDAVESYRFGVYEFSPRTSELLKSGLPVRLQEQTASILHFLLTHPAQLVTRQQLQEVLWPDGIHVDFETGLNSAVGRLRQTLMDSGKSPRYIETIPKKGYRWIAPVERIEAGQPVVPSAVEEVRPPAAQPPIELTQTPLPILPPMPSLGRRELFGALAGLGALGAFAVWRTLKSPNGNAARDKSRHTSVVLPTDRSLHTGWGRSLTIDPAGKELAYVARSASNNTPLIYRYNLSSGSSSPVAGSEGGEAPDYSPDGTRLAWTGASGIFTGGDATQPRAIHQWSGPATVRVCRYSPEGHLLFLQPDSLPEGSETGLTSSCWLWKSGAAKPDKIQIPYGGKGLETIMPQMLVDDRYLVYSSNLGPETRSVSLFDLRTNRGRQLVAPGMGGFLKPPGPNSKSWKLIYYWAGSLLAADLDLESMTLRSQPLVVLSGVASASWAGPDAYLGADGTLVYTPEEPTTDWRLVWMSVDGKESPVPVPRGPYSVADLSEDGRHLLLLRKKNSEFGTLLHYDLKTGSSRELVEHAGWRACWGPRAESIAYASIDSGAWMTSLHVMDTRTLQTQWKMQSTNLGHFPFQWDAKSGEIYYAEGYHARSRIDIWKVPAGDEGRKTPLATSLAVETHPALSPDGSMLAFSSDTSVRIRSLTGGETLFETTLPRATAPMWAADSRTIYVRRGRAIHAASVEPGKPPRIGPLRELFQGNFVPATQWQPNAFFDRVHKRFLMIVQDAETPPRRRIEIITNWLGDGT